MTVASALNRKTFTGDAVTTSFGTSPVVFFSSGDLDVYVVTTATGAATLLTENTHYTVTGGGSSPAVGTVSLAGGTSPYGAPAATQTLVIVRNIDILQAVDFVQNDSSDAEVAEAALDRITMITQQLSALQARSFTLDDSDVSGADTTLPTPEVGMLVGWATGPVLANYDPATSLSGVYVPTAFVATLFDDANADTFVQTLVAGLTAEPTIATDDVLLIGDTSESKGNKMTTANLWKVVNAFTADALPDRTADYVASYDASASGAKKILLNDLPLPPMSISGLTYANNASDATNDIDIAVGSCRDATNAVNMVLAATLTKRSDATFVVGSGNGGLDTGAVGNSDYYIWLIKRSDTGVVDAIFSLSSTAPTMPTSYDYKRLVGWVKRTGGTIVAFHTYETEGGGLDLNWDSPTLDVNLANTLTTARRTDAVKVPLNFSVVAYLNIGINDATTGHQDWVYCPDQADLAPSVTVAPLATLSASNNAVAAFVPLTVRTSATGTIAARSNLATVDLYAVVTLGFRWARRN